MSGERILLDGVQDALEYVAVQMTNGLSEFSALRDMVVDIIKSRRSELQLGTMLTLGRAIAESSFDLSARREIASMVNSTFDAAPSRKLPPVDAHRDH